ncbi:hypothetical protein BDV39DRAFT_190397 [Aspergillus sergii]|uniref:Uncharacterized protein n=1 Tax=Aspergillus sergii TaxID=1034303 RepID=A0A5N6XC31_9EURO|nr:hypothetical protein BDV39DRAFT_190397 [Aspergillus sergii]
MSDAVRPSKESFESVLHRSWHTWSSFRDAHDGRSTLPTHCIDLRNILGQTPGFLAANALPDGLLSFGCFEEGEGSGPYDLFAKGKSTWKTSNGTCDTKPRTIPKQLLLATQIPAKIEFSVDAPFEAWPKIEDIYHETEANHITASFLVWAYILSARWAELLDRSTNHHCRIEYSNKTNHVILEEFKEYAEIVVADGFDEAKVFWWNAILAGNSGWKITTEYNQKTYLSPWSISIQDRQFASPRQITADGHFTPPLSFTAFQYLVRFCSHHQLYSQCLAAVSAALYIPLLSGRLASLPIPKLFANAWLNPAFSVINPILENGNLLAPLWLGAIMTGIARSELRDIRNGLTAIDLHAAAWTGTTNSFITLKPGVAQEHTIRREDECRLLFITASDGYTRHSDTDLAVREHAHCGCHCFEYHAWDWCLTNGEIEDPGLKLTPSVGEVLQIGEGLELPPNIPCDDSLSAGETRSIFQWLRMSGYPASERAIYQHEWNGRWKF